MTKPLLLWLTGALLAADLLLALAAYSLRAYSRSKLDEVCTRRNRKARFSAILKQDERALLVVEWLLVLVTLAATALLFSQRQLWQTIPDGPASWFRIAAEWLLLAGAYSLVLTVLPWSIARVGGERFLCSVWPPLALLLKLCAPVVAFFALVDKFAHRLSGLEETAAENGPPIAEEIRSVVDEGRREGLLESAAGTMIQRVMELQSEDSAAVMTPRTDMFCISADDTLEEAREQLLEAGHTRVPVIGESTDDIVGILHAKDLLKFLGDEHAPAAANGPAAQRSLRDIVREPFYVPETTGVDTLLENMRRERVHMAIVLDEYGGVAGLVTMEDILEEIVGEITDEYDKEEEDGIDAIRHGLIEVDARVHIDDLNEQFGFDLPEDGDFDTVGGFVFDQLARVPEPGDQLTWQKLRVTVLDADKRSIKRLRIEVDESLLATAEEG